MLYTKMDLTLAALIGHDGFGAPGAASPGHWLHHKLINVNVSRLRVACVGAGREAPLAKISISPIPHPPQYGENYAPVDWLVGSFAADEDDYIARFGKASAEAEKSKAH